MPQEAEMPLDEAGQFRRVWQRVQPDQGDAALAVRPAPPVSRPPAPEPERPDFMLPPPRPLPPPARPPEMPPPPQAPQRGWEEDFLRDAIRENACLARCCRRFPPLRGMAARLDGQSRRLAAALFLLTGRRFRPEWDCPPAEYSLAGCARSLYFRLGKTEEGYRQAEARTREPGLGSLFHELAGECAILRQRLRRVIEQAMEV